MNGLGTINDPYLIADATDLYGLSAVAANYNYLAPMYVRQTADIHLGNTNRDPISTPLAMQYDGGFFRIRGFRQTGASTLFGLFQRVDGQIRNLGIEGWVAGGSGGAFAHTMMAIPVFNFVVAENCYFSGTANATDVNGLTGGICAVALVIGATSGETPVFRNVAVRAGITSNGYTGGVVGYGNPRYDNCYTACDFGVTTPGASQVAGGFVGFGRPEYIGTPSRFRNTHTVYDAGFSDYKATTHGRSTAQMMQAATFAGWDFSTLWAIHEGASYPWIFAFTPATSAPTADPAAGDYPAGAPVPVTLQCQTPDARIYYTVDGSTPDYASLMATSGSTISIMPPKTLRMLARSPYRSGSSVSALIYSLADAVADPVCDPPGGEYPAGAITVTVTCATAGATIHYTIYGETPTTGSPTIANGGTINRSTLNTHPLKLLAVKSGMSDSAIVTAAYTAAPSVATPTLTPAGGAYTGAQVPVTLYCSTPGAIIRYVLSASAGAGYSPAAEEEPTEYDAGILSGGVISVPIAATLNVKAFKDGLTPSAHYWQEYTSKIDTPVLSPASGGTADDTMPVVVTCGTASVTMHYSLDGSTPDETDPPVAHGASLDVPVPATLKVVAYRLNYATSDVAIGSYTQAAATQTLPFTRYTRQVRTEPNALLATSVAAIHALDLLKAAPWVATATQQSTLPARNALSDGFLDSWDAFKHVGNYAMDDAGIGYQRAYAGMVAYRLKVPAAAITATRDLVSVAVPVHVDRWLVDGIRLAAHLSDSGYPSTDWDVVREGDVHVAANYPMQYSPDRITDTNPLGAVLLDKAGTITITYPAGSTVKKYLWLYLSIEDYTTTRGSWIEGSALFVGGGLRVEFDAAVTLDPPVNPILLLPTAVFDYLAPDEDTIAAASRYTDNNATVEYAYPATASDLMLSAYFDNAILQSADVSWVASSIATANATYETTGTATIDVTAGILPMIIGVTKGGALAEIITHTAIDSYPDWMQIRLNIYAIHGPTADQKAASTTRAAMIAARSAWAAGTHSEGGYVNLLSVDLSPDGYPAFSTWRAKPVIIPPGISAIYVSAQILNITGTPAAAGTAHGLELSMSAMSFRLA